MYSPSKLTDFLSCSHLAALELALEKGILSSRPRFEDPLTELLRKQGQEHEKRYLRSLMEKGKQVEEILDGNFGEKAKKTLSAMRDGAEVIYQAALTDGEWKGYADFLIKTDNCSDLGKWSYNVEDTKLSTNVKGYAVMQLCIYAELVGKLQGKLPDKITVIGGDGTPHSFYTNDFTAYLRYSRRKFLKDMEMDLTGIEKVAPEPVERCHYCNWRQHCETIWKEKDHLKLVAGTSRLMRKELQNCGIDTLTALGELTEPPVLKRSSNETVYRIYSQAKIQLKSRRSGKPEHEFIEPLVDNQGLAALPKPDKGDIWFDIEGDHHIDAYGLEYLFGWVSVETGIAEYHEKWACNNEEERSAFRGFIQFALDQKKRYPEMHIYHFGHYETTAVKKLSTRYNLMVEEVDDLLRQEVFVDLLRVVKNGLRLSVENYGLKEIEGHYSFLRETDLRDAGKARKSITILLDGKSDLPAELCDLVQDYNREDCFSTYELHKWLEERREDLIKEGREINRPLMKTEYSTSEKVLELGELCNMMYKLLPEGLENLTDEQKALKTLADLLLWYRREDKSNWWEFFRLKDLTREELFEERKGLAGPFEFLCIEEEIGNYIIYKWKFPSQIFDGEREDINFCDDSKKVSFEIYNIDSAQGYLWTKVKKNNGNSLCINLRSTDRLFAHRYYRNNAHMRRFKDLANCVIGSRSLMDGNEFHLSRNLLLKRQHLHNGKPLRRKKESVLDAAKRLCMELKEGNMLPIQGPPGSGKTFTAAHMICELIRNGKKAGITAQSHSVIRNLMNEVKKVNDEYYQIDLKAVKKIGSTENKEDIAEWIDVIDEYNFNSDYNLYAGTSWFWCDESLKNMVDVLFIDEAGQFSLADAVACSCSVPAMVLMGDPQQLENVVTGVHPPEVVVSALGYWIEEEKKVIDGGKGLFLENTYRMTPDINTFISKTFYEGKLHISEGLERQKIVSSSRLTGSGIRYIPCDHEGNQSSSEEEVALIAELVTSLLDGGSWIDKNGKELPLKESHIMIVAPYNAQVNALKEALPGVESGTVDKFQGKQAPVVIYSMATSSPEEAPRGMEFLYSLNRLNVAMSRAQCMAVMVACPDLFELSCKTPRQMQLANAHCSFLEMCEVV